MIQHRLSHVLTLIKGQTEPDVSQMLVWFASTYFHGIIVNKAKVFKAYNQNGGGGVLLWNHCLAQCMYINWNFVD